MTEQAIEAAIAPIVATALEDLHQHVSAEITRLEKAIPLRLNAADQDVQDWAHDAVNTLHALVARIDQHRQGASTEPAESAPAPVAAPAAPAPAPATPPAPSTPAQPATTTTPAAAK